MAFKKKLPSKPTSIVDDYSYLNRRLAELKAERDEGKEYEYCEECGDDGWVYNDYEDDYFVCVSCRNQYGRKKPPS
jgi:hypothetical protein